MQKLPKIFKFFKNSDQSGMIDLDKNVDEDLCSILDTIFPGVSPEMKDFLKCQRQVLQASTSTQRKWDKSVIKTCLSLWSRSPKCYQDLKENNIFVLPSGSLLQRYKNSVPQNPGIQQEMLEWMANTARKQGVPRPRYYGGHIHDETKIQEDLVMNTKSREDELVGWINTGDETQTLRILKEKTVQQTLATQVLQISFLGYTGFRFPIAHFPTDGVTASELYLIIWDLISNLQSWGFTVDFILQDGGEQNREFIKLHFENDLDAQSKSYMSDNLVNYSRKVAHSQDFSHNVKKLRNACLSSGNHSHNTRMIKKGENIIVWDHWIDAVRWDEQTNSRRIYHKIGQSHLYPDSAEKMRNHLAEEVLDINMYNLMKHYKLSLKNGNILNSTLELLHHSSELIKIF